MNQNELKTKINERILNIDKKLKEYVNSSSNPQKIIYDAMEYSLLAGGKRLRPILLLECSSLCGGDENEAMPFACAMEMIHTYSLIHDDLPSMDNDDLRRGMPTNHIKYGEAIAILAGDALLNKAFEVMSEYGKDAKNAMKAFSIIAKSSGSEGMIGGQIVDIESEDKDIDIETLQYLHSLKTGAIIRSACVAGAVIAGADEKQIKAVDDFALNLGIAFQIQDDILDVTGNEADLGKPIGSDAQQNKNTYVKLFGLEKSKELVIKYSDLAKSALSVFGSKADFLLSLADYLVNRNS